MLHKIIKRTFYLLINFLHFLQVSLVFLAFATCLFWIFQLAQVPFIQVVAPFFESIRDFVHIFYTRRVTIDAMTVDFSFLIATFMMLLTSYGLNFVADYFKGIEKKYDSIYRRFKAKSEKNFNAKLKMDYVSSENKNNKFLILIKFEAQNAGLDVKFNKDANVGVTDIQKEALLTFCNNLATHIVFQKKLINDSVLLYFEDFSKIDIKLLALVKVISDLKAEYKARKWTIDFVAGIDAFSNDREVVEKCENLTKLLKLDLKNEITCLSSFNSRYLFINNQKHYLVSKGTYRIKNEEEVFALKHRAVN